MVWGFHCIIPVYLCACVWVYALKLDEWQARWVRSMRWNLRIGAKTLNNTFTIFINCISFDCLPKFFPLSFSLLMKMISNAHTNLFSFFSLSSWLDCLTTLKHLLIIFECRNDCLSLSEKKIKRSVKCSITYVKCVQWTCTLYIAHMFWRSLTFFAAFFEYLHSNLKWDLSNRWNNDNYKLIERINRNKRMKKQNNFFFHDIKIFYSIIFFYIDYAIWTEKKIDVCLYIWCIS